MSRLASVNITPLSGVAKERGVPKRQSGLPVPLPWVPWEILDESSFKDPVEWGLFVWGGRVPGYLESCSRSFL